MLFWTHLIVGIFMALLLYPISTSHITFIVVLIISSLLPDIDSPTSKIGRNGVSKTFSAFFKHRGIVHSVFFIVLIYFILRSFWMEASLPFLIGYSTHLVLDLLTPRGLKPFWPFKKRIKGFIRSGSLFEVFFFIVFLILDAILFSIRLLGW